MTRPSFIARVMPRPTPASLPYARLVAVRLRGVDVTVTVCDGVVHPK
ncbi:hypothetical protein [Corynebacterium diphtheriae]|nr:hypothetical protein [Corynebacterium diphtheriae]